MNDRQRLITQLERFIRVAMGDPASNDVSQLIEDMDKVRQFASAFFDPALISIGLPPGTFEAEDIISEVIGDFEEEASILRAESGVLVGNNERHVHWLNRARSRIDTNGGWFFWDRYENYLQYMQNWPRVSVASIFNDTERILQLLEDPTLDREFERRGLVMASVQSGKTANYIGLMSRAADAGYKVFIVMAGVHNALRNQTQERIEEGFIGFDKEGRRLVGVGKPGDVRRPETMTTRSLDFNKDSSKFYSENARLIREEDPIVFVIKKNISTLNAVYEWITRNVDPNKPLLMIDDEADNASINVQYKEAHPDRDPSKINGKIRQILNFFTRKAYVGYTATPFANIFIDAEVDSEEYGTDLFPSDFIYAVGDQSTYFGARKMFEPSEGGRYPYKYLRFIFDGDALLEQIKDDDEDIAVLPNSLYTAIRQYILSRAVRSIRGDGDKHSGMLINVSPFKGPQSQITRLVKRYYEALRADVEVNGALSYKRAHSASPAMRELRETWLEDYDQTLDYDWVDIYPHIQNAVRDISVVCINSDTNDTLDYRHEPVHAIVIGGYRLSRGLTIEGLTVSYYLRSARNYDSLMQMGRWFGYRNNYRDLCRIWMTEEAAGWYEFVTEATEELVDDIRIMGQMNKTPREYGLRIRQSPESLMVTAANKIGVGKRSRAVNLNNGFVETIAVSRDPEDMQRNDAAVRRLIANAVADGANVTEGGLLNNVRAQIVLDFLADYQNDDAFSPASMSGPVRTYIIDRNDEGELLHWDVYIASGNGKEVDLGEGFHSRREVRKPGKRSTDLTYTIGDRQRLSSRDVERQGLSEEEQKLAEQAFRDENKDKKGAAVSGKYYRKYRNRPLLVIHPIQLMYSERQKQDYREKGLDNPPLTIWPGWSHSEEAIGWSISFPESAYAPQPVEYVFNAIPRGAFDEEGDEIEEDE